MSLKPGSEGNFVYKFFVPKDYVQPKNVVDGVLFHDPDLAGLNLIRVLLSHC